MQTAHSHFCVYTLTHNDSQWFCKPAFLNNVNETSWTLNPSASAGIAGVDTATVWCEKLLFVRRPGGCRGRPLPTGTPAGLPAGARRPWRTRVRLLSAACKQREVRLEDKCGSLETPKKAGRKCNRNFLQLISCIIVLMKLNLLLTMLNWYIANLSMTENSC